MSEQEHLLSENKDMDGEKKGMCQLCRESVLMMRQIPKDLWFTYAVVFCHYFMLMSIYLTVPQLLTDEYGYSDTAAGLVYATIGGVQSIQSVMIGTFIDRLGIKKSVMIASAISVVAGLIITFAENEGLFIFGLVFILPLAGALSIPAGKIAPRRYTIPATRPAAYSLFFVTLQAGQSLGFGIVDAFLLGSDDGQILTKYRQISFLGAFFCFAAFLLSFLITDMDYESSGAEEVNPIGQRYSSWEIIKSLVITKNFWRYASLVGLTFGALSAHRFLDAALPKYMERTIGGNSLYGTMLMLSSLSTLIFAPLFTPLVYKYTNYTLMVIGSMIIAGTTFFPLIDSNYVVISFMCIIQGSGESIFSPRLWEYSISVAPKGKEGSYMALAALPHMAGAFFAGILSGVLLDEYCPDDGGDTCRFIWFLIGMIAVTTTVGMIVLRRCIEEPAYDPEPFCSCSDEAKDTLKYNNEKL